MFSFCKNDFSRTRIGINISMNGSVSGTLFEESYRSKHFNYGFESFTLSTDWGQKSSLVFYCGRRKKFQPSGIGKQTTGKGKGVKRYQSISLASQICRCYLFTSIWRTLVLKTAKTRFRRLLRTIMLFF